MLKKKLCEVKAETLVEALVTILILALSMSILAMGLGAAQKITAPLRSQKSSFSVDNYRTETITVHLDGCGSTLNFERTGHITENGYYYYD